MASVSASPLSCSFGEFCLAHLLLKRSPAIFFQHFIECIFHFNNYEKHEKYNKFPQSERSERLSGRAGLGWGSCVVRVMEGAHLCEWWCRGRPAVGSLWAAGYTVHTDSLLKCLCDVVKLCFAIERSSCFH